MPTTFDDISLPTWPLELPIAPLISAYQEQYPSLISSVTSGNKSKLIRKTSTRSQISIIVHFNLTKDQVDSFVSFIDDVLEGGAVRFTFRHPRTYEQIEVSLDPTQTNRFTIDPNGSMDYFKVTTQFIVWS